MYTYIYIYIYTHVYGGLPVLVHAHVAAVEGVLVVPRVGVGHKPVDGALALLIMNTP